jgi:hypothetical protein
VFVVEIRLGVGAMFDATSVMSCTAFTLLNHTPFFSTQGPNAGARSSDSDEFFLIMKRASTRRERPLRAARDKTSVPECISNSRYLITDTHVACKWRHAQLRAHNLHTLVFFNRANAAGLLWRPASLGKDQPVRVGNAPK